MEIWSWNILFIAMVNQFYLFAGPKRIRAFCVRVANYQRSGFWFASETDLIKLIDETVTIRNIFVNCGEPPFILSWNGSGFQLSIGEVPEELLPDDEFLELSSEETVTYRKSLYYKSREPTY